MFSRIWITKPLTEVVVDTDTLLEVVIDCQKDERDIRVL
jgi:hypothetical protein